MYAVAVPDEVISPKYLGGVRVVACGFGRLGITNCTISPSSSGTPADALGAVDEVLPGVVIAVPVPVVTQ